MNKKYTIVYRRSDFVMWRTPVWETILATEKTEKNPVGILFGGLKKTGLLKIDSYKEARKIAKTLTDEYFMNQYKVVNVNKIPEIIKTTKTNMPDWLFGGKKKVAILRK